MNETQIVFMIIHTMNIEDKNNTCMFILLIPGTVRRLGLAFACWYLLE